MKKFDCIILALLVLGTLPLCLTAQTPYMLKDIVSGAAGSAPYVFREMNSVLYFSGNSKLWRSDGSAAGTYLVKDVGVGSDFGILNGNLYFTGPGSKTGSTALWMSNGTAAGTTLLKSSMWPHTYTLSNNILYFINQTGSYPSTDYALWKTDGTSKGTIRVKDINPSGADRIGNFHDGNSKLFFNAFHSSYGLELWKSDGTSSGTTLIKDICPGNGTCGTTITYPWARYPGQYTTGTYASYNGSGAFYFVASDGTGATELWKSNGTSNGTVRLTNENLAGNFYPHWPCQVGGKLFFSADDGVHGFELWQLDLVTQACSMVADIKVNGTGSWPIWLTAVGSTLYFSADDGDHGRELWKYDGVSAPVMVADINTAGSSNPNDIDADYASWHPMTFAQRNGVIYFQANDGASGVELWRSDGTGTGTWRMADINPGAASSNPDWLTVIGSTLFFSADNGTNGTELWAVNGLPKQQGEAGEAPLPTTVTLQQNYPNPFNPSTVISYSVPLDAQVRLSVFDIRGSLVRTLVDGVQTAGTHSVLFDVQDLPNGTYMYRLEAEGKTITRMMTLLK
jgi:trimeric autotransporter adhesin